LSIRQNKQGGSAQPLWFCGVQIAMSSSKPKVIVSEGGRLGFELDALSEHLDMPVSDLKDALIVHALSDQASEAERLNAQEYFDKKSKVFPRPPFRDVHVIATARTLFPQPIESDE